MSTYCTECGKLICDHQLDNFEVTESQLEQAIKSIEYLESKNALLVAELIDLQKQIVEKDKTIARLIERAE